MPKIRSSIRVSGLWLGTGKRNEARQQLTQALAGFTEGFGEVDLRAASELLEKIDNEGT